MNFRSAVFPKEHGSGLAEIILSANADVVCIHEICVNDANEIYEALQEEYAQFLYLNTHITTQIFSGHHYHPNGMLIASKCNIEKPRFNRFQRPCCVNSCG